MSNRGMNGEVGVRLLTLSDCDYCMWLKSELDSCGITYVDIDAYQHSTFADEVENRFKTKYYPMVFVEAGDEVITIVSETELEDSKNLRTYDTIPNLVEIIKTYIK